MQEGLSQPVRQLIIERVDSVVQLEVLLLLVNHPEDRWTAAAVSQQLRIDANWAAGELATLAARGLAAPVTDISAPADGAAGVAAGAAAYRFAPATPELGRAVAELSQAYADRRVTVVTFIFSKPLDKIQTFADAFRLRKGKGDG